jgi:phosphatidylinositol alpha-1,6-mannosyltransferase
MHAKPKLVFCNHLFMAPLAALVAFLVRARLVIQLHGIEIWNKPTKLQLWGLRSANLLFCVSRDTRARLLTHCDIPPERALVLNNTVGPEFTPDDRSKARERFGFRDEFVLLTVGRLDARERYKGHDRVIEAIKHIRTSCTRPLIYLIAGDGDDKQRLERMARDQGVSDQVRFLGRVAPNCLPDLYRASNLFVLPSTGEGFGIAFVEAMACGTPAIGLAIGGAPDALGDGSLGACVSPEEFPGALASALQQYRKHHAELPGLVKERFGREAFSTELANQLALLLAPDKYGR